jgi:type IV pilus assembly protein PilA
MRVRRGAIFAVAGVVLFLGYASQISVRWNRAGLYAGETSAIKAIQSLNTAQVQYNSQFGRYARSLSELAAPAYNLIPADLASGESRGYKFSMTEKPGGYTIQAMPTAFGHTGVRTFYSDQSLRIRENYGAEPATAESRELGRPVFTK